MKYEKLAADRLIEIYNLRKLLLKNSIFYNPLTGTIKRKSTGRILKHNDIKDFIIEYHGIRTTAKRAIYLYMTGEEAPTSLYFIDRNVLNLKWENLTLDQTRVGYANKPRVINKPNYSEEVRLTPIAIRWYEKNQAWSLIKQVGRRVLQGDQYVNWDDAYNEAMRLNSLAAEKHPEFEKDDIIPETIT